MGREEGNDSMGVGGRDGGEEGGCVEGAGVEEVGRLSAGFEGEGTKGKDVGGEAGLEERGFVGRYSGGGRLGQSSHRSNSDQISRL